MPSLSHLLRRFVFGVATYVVAAELVSLGSPTATAAQPAAPIKSAGAAHGAPRGLQFRDEATAAAERTARNTPTAEIQLVAAEEEIVADAPKEAEPVPPSTGEAQWIWSPTQAPGVVPKGAVLFRKWFNSSAPELAFVQITCDDRYDVYVNGRLVGTGKDWHKMQSFDLMPFLLEGRNLIAVKAENLDGATGGLTARVIVKRKGGAEVGYSTDESWLTTTVESLGWEKNKGDDSKWLKARSLGELGVAKPWLDNITADDGSSTRRFTVAKDFRIERVVSPLDTGSLLTFTFNEWGEIYAAREQGPILLIVDSNKDGVPDKVTEYCAAVQSCQGLLALNGQVYALGMGPDGCALYRIADENQDGKGEKVQKLVEFDGKPGEHGPHGLSLGPDGLIYAMIGNHSQAKGIAPKGSPYHDYYEGDLLTPKYEDPGGHAVGIRSPGGTVLRLDSEGKNIQLYSGGFRNAYDLAFNREGELFTFDSDMEWDEGLPWYRPTRLDHVYAGSEHGWRSGWSTWPDYHLDTVPPAATAGRGSPTGLEFYNHNRYPQSYNNALFACDWSQGEIIAFKPKASGSGYTSEGEVFVRGRPLAVTDVAVGPDGWLYFTTGGRGTEGGVNRVVYTGVQPTQPKLTGVAQAVRQPQLQAAWARQNVALLQEQNKEAWAPQLLSVASNATNRHEDRVRALDLLQLYGPFPELEFLTKLTRDPQPQVRKKAAYLLGIHAEPTGGGALVLCLRDPDPAVRRQACESLVRGAFLPPPEPLLPLLADTDRAVAFSARLALEQLPVENWKKLVLETKNVNVFFCGSVALMRMSPDRETALAVLRRGSQTLAGELTDNEFLDLLRTIEIALERGKITGEDVPALRKQLAEEYPAGELRMNRELLKILGYMNEPTIIPRMVAFLKSDAPQLEKIPVALMSRFITSGWTIEQKLVVFEFYEKARKFEGGYSLKGYFDNVCRDFCKDLTPREKLVLLSYGVRHPSNAFALLASLEKVEGDLIPMLVELDKRLPQNPTEEARKLQTGVIAVLGEAKDERGMVYLREAFEKQPERRVDLAMGLAQQADGENYPLLLRSLAIVDGVAAQEVMLQLAKVDRKPESPEAVRQAILCGLRLGDEGASTALALLQKWTGQNFAAAPGTKWNTALASYQQWFTKTYPDLPPATPPKTETASRYSLEELTAFLAESSTKGDATHGAAIFEKTSCVKCHRFGNRGEAVGPDLSAVAQRFTRKEILESILYPSQVISDQYSSKIVTTVDGKTLSGIVAPSGSDSVVVLQANGEKTVIANKDVESTSPGKKSSMPEGLLNSLQLQDVADLFAYFNSNGPTPSNIAAPAARQTTADNKNQSRRPTTTRK
ncbi:MAG: HEAT repeat domain-containing protein [Planctomycetia bacterium]|nr:HEAT repeat domain-containing protein [Planctomycetia bacterium]